MDKSKFNMLFVLIIIIVVVVIILTFKGVFSEKTELKEAEEDSINYEVNSDGSRVNMSEEISKDQKVGQILIEKSSIVFENGMSKLTSKVTNDNEPKENLRFTIKIIDNSDNIIAELIGLAGKIEAGQTKYINSKITQDITNGKRIIYEIIE